jgi:hypothetical protein
MKFVRTFEEYDKSKIFAPLEFTTNMLGKLKDEKKKEIMDYIKHPTYEGWEEIAHYLVTPNKTLWQAVIAIDSTFPLRSRRTNDQGKILKDWDKIPTPEQIKDAIRKIVY